MSVTPICTEEESFLVTLEETPYDWTTRLIYADWLEERNDPRGVGMRVVAQLQLLTWRRSDAKWTTCHWLWDFSRNTGHSQRGIFDIPPDSSRHRGEIIGVWFAHLTGEEGVENNYREAVVAYSTANAAYDDLARTYPKLSDTVKQKIQEHIIKEMEQ